MPRALLVDNCPRCGAEHITFDVMGAIPAGRGHTDWLKRFEVFCCCRRCRRSTTFAMEIEKYDDRDKFDDPAAFTKDVTLNSSFKVLGYISEKDGNRQKPPSDLPQDIEAAFNEGATCMSVQCWNAASAMFRLCLDLATRPLLPPEDQENGPNRRQRRDLGLRVPWLIEHGLLPRELAELAGAVREDGNDGAHAGNLSEADADYLLDFTVLLLSRLYTESAKLAAAAARRSERRNPSDVA